MDFGTLKSDLLAVIGRAPAAVCYRLLTADINQLMRLHQMEQEVTLTEGATVALPADFLEVVTLYRDTDPRQPLRPLPPQALQRTFRPSGMPVRYSIEDGQLRLSPAPSGPENLVLRYYAKLANLVADTDTNDVMAAYPALYTYGALTHHALLIRDEKAARSWGFAYNEAKKQARSDSNKYRAGAGTSAPVAPAVA